MIKSENNKIKLIIIVVVTFIILMMGFRCSSKLINFSTDETRIITHKAKYLTIDNIDYISNKSFNSFIELLQEKELYYYIDYIREKFKDKNKYKYNYCEDGSFRFLDEYMKAYIPAFKSDDMFSYIASLPGYEGMYDLHDVYTPLHDHGIYGLIGISSIDINNDDKLELIIVESKPFNYHDCCKYEYSITVLSYKDSVYESNSISFDEHYLPATTFHYYVDLRKIENEVFIYLYNELTNDYDGDGTIRSCSIYRFVDTKIEKVGSIAFDEDFSEWSEDEMIERQKLIDRYLNYPINRLSSIKLCDIYNKKCDNGFLFIFEIKMQEILNLSFNNISYF